MENQLIWWKTTEDKCEWHLGPFVIRNLWGTTDVFEDAPVIEALVELWRKFFDVVLPWYEPDRWDSVICSIQIDHGKFDIIPTENLDFRGSVGRVNLTFRECDARLLHGDFPSDEAFELECQREEKRFVDALMTAWTKVRSEPTIARIVESRVIPFRIINNGEDYEGYDSPSLLHVDSLGDYATT